MFEILLSGLLTSVLVLFLTICHESTKEQNKLAGFARLLEVEINEQLFWLANYKENFICYNKVLRPNSPVWNNVRYCLAANLNQEDLKVFIEHFRNVNAASFLLGDAGEIDAKQLANYKDNACMCLLLLSKIEPTTTCKTIMRKTLLLPPTKPRVSKP